MDIVISDTADITAQKMIKEGHYVMTKESTPNICVPDNKASKYVKPKLPQLKGETDKSTVIVGDFNPSLNNKENN